MIRGVRVGMATALMAAATLAAAPDQQLGKGVKIETATSIKALYENPGKFVGKTIRIDGVVTAVCEEMGCWMAIADSDKSEQTVRLQVDHDGAIVFPISAKGKRASAEGVFEKIAADDTHAQNAASEQAAKIKTPEFSKTYQIKATGAVVR